MGGFHGVVYPFSDELVYSCMIIQVPNTKSISIIQCPRVF
jgi:hypothetical protein